MGILDLFRKKKKIDLSFEIKTGFQLDDQVDINWSLEKLNEEKIKAEKKKDYGRVSYILFVLARKLYENNKDHSKILFESHKFSLLNYINTSSGGPAKKVKILTAGNSACINCKKLEGKIFTIKEALEEKILPCKNCVHEINPTTKLGWCRCMYLPVLEY